MQRIELEAKRVRKIHWGPRTLDLDLLFYDQEIIATERLNVPHPDMANRETHGRAVSLVGASRNT